MSHVATVDVEITNLDDLDAACRRIGLELVRDQKTYCWYGTTHEKAHKWQHELPPGFSNEDLGKCDHAVRVPGVADSEQYEIGICKRRDGKPGFVLTWDAYGEIAAKIGGRQMSLLKQAYAVCAAKRVAQLQGFRLQEQQTPNGGIRMILTK